MDLQEKFKELYNLIVSSRDTKKMRILGDVTKDVMETLINSHPSLADEFINRLESVEWSNYLTSQEADEIFPQITPNPKWSWNQWVSKTQELKVPVKDFPHYNEYALFITMCIIDATSRETISEFLSEDQDYTTIVYKLALDQLKSEDGFFNLRDQVRAKLGKE